MNAPLVAWTALGTGVAGWALENALYAPPTRYSYHLPGVPLLPVYAAGGAAVVLMAPHLRALTPSGKFLVYAAVLTSIEALAGLAERVEGRRSWDYDGLPADLAHAALWGALGLGLDYVLPK